jgi:hypothetical protein
MANTPNIAAMTEKLKAETKALQNALNKNQKAAAAAPTAMEGAVPAINAAKLGNEINNKAVAAQKLIQQNGGNPATNNNAQKMARAAMEAANKNAQLAQNIAAKAVGTANAQPTPVNNKGAATATNNATKAAQAAITGNTTGANNALAQTAVAAAKVSANSSPAANRVGANVAKNIK